jgi:hypothetical protein
LAFWSGSVMKSLPRDWEQNSDTSSAVFAIVPDTINGFSRDGGGSGCKMELMGNIGRISVVNPDNSDADPDSIFI